jgi:hypothetical protein
MIDYVILVLGLAGLLRAYYIARRMSWRTCHGMRLAIIGIGIGCVMAMLHHHDIAVALLLAGGGLHQIMDRRGGCGHDRDHPGRVRILADQPAEQRRRADEPAAPLVHAMGFGVPAAPDRQNDRIERAAA